MRIRPYISNSDFEEIRKWITDERTHSMWCANLLNYPLEKENVEDKLAEMAVKFCDSPYVATGISRQRIWSGNGCFGCKICL